MLVESAGTLRCVEPPRGACHARDRYLAVRLGPGTGHCPRPDVPRADRPRTRALACHLAVEPGLEPSQGRPCARARCTHDRRLGAVLSHPWTSRDRLRADRWLPPALMPEQQTALAAALRRPPREAGIPTATWTGRAVVQFVRTQFDVVLSQTSARRYLHRLGFVRKRPKKQLGKADADQRTAFVRTYAEVVADAARTGARMLFVDEAHFRADAELAWQWTPRGEPALVPSTSPRRAEKAAYYSAV